MGKIEGSCLIEPRLAPLDLTDTEILDFLSEYSYQINWNRANHKHNEEFTVHCDHDIKATSSTLRMAACLAAAMHTEANS